MYVDKILFLTNNDHGMELYNWIKNNATCQLKLQNTPLNLEEILSLSPDLIIGYNYQHIICEEIIHNFENSIINLHISLLPWNRGASPNFWSIVDNTPKGVTIHLMDSGIDTGKILFQKEVFIDDRETLRSSYLKLQSEIQNLFIKNWKSIQTKSWKAKPQRGKGSFHLKKDFEKVKSILDPYSWDIPIYILKDRIQKMRKNNEKIQFI